ncbi:hypothetical protein ACFL59_00480 [Planctomycetota bacterium]
MDRIRDAFRGVILRDLRPLEDKDGVRIGENCRIYKDKKGYTVRFLKGTEEKQRKTVRDKLDLAKIEYKEGKDWRD